MKIRREELEDKLMEQIDSLYNTAYRLSKSESDAEDLVQETFLKACRFFHQYSQKSSFKAWLFQILRNTYFNSYRKAKREMDKLEVENIDDVSDIEVDERFFSLSLNRAQHFNSSTDVGDEVKKALDCLTDESKLAIILKDVEGFSFKEIAEINGDPIGTVITRVHRARKILAHRLENYARDIGYLSPQSSDNEAE